MIKIEPEEDLRSSQGWRSMDFVTAGALTALSFVVYLFTMSRSIPYIDGGELTTVLWTLGIAHPTGYPLFTLLGYAFVHIPFFPKLRFVQVYSLSSVPQFQEASSTLFFFTHNLCSHRLEKSPSPRITSKKPRNRMSQGTTTMGFLPPDWFPPPPPCR